ncbi:hypothetical protein Tco_0975384 [Tanacetum coccineum]|uniref:Reverse transcriptase domain-containing protein n=1 Tax=Tanacetum coccineum TaxID=301880 RepID=A0ABQ5EFF6_9ASTR
MTTPHVSALVDFFAGLLILFDFLVGSSSETRTVVSLGEAGFMDFRAFFGGVAPRRISNVYQIVISGGMHANLVSLGDCLIFGKEVVNDNFGKSRIIHLVLLFVTSVVNLVMEFESAQSNTIAKLPILKLSEYEMWVIRIKQYFQMSVPVTAEEKTNKKNDVKIVGHDVAYAMTWIDLRKKMTNKYCPRNEIKKLETEMFPEESDKVERYVGGLPDMIHGSVVASKPKTMQEATEMATELMDKKISTFAETSSLRT